MISKEIVSKKESHITEEDRTAHKLVYYAMVNENRDELREAFKYIYNLFVYLLIYL